jgi:hypothetical protein
MDHEAGQRKPNAPPKIRRLKLVGYSFLSVAVLVTAVAFTFFFYTDAFINTFIKSRITHAVQNAYPQYLANIGAMHYSIRDNRLAFDSVTLATVDSTLSIAIAAYSLSGIGWLDLFLARGFVPNGFTGTVLNAHGIVVNFPQEQYEVSCKFLHVSVPDSTIELEDLVLLPSVDENRFFKHSKFRRTRFRVSIPDIKGMGLATLDLLQGKQYRVRSVHIIEPFVDVLINKDKSSAKDTSRSLMPNEMFALIKDPVAVDSVNIRSGGLKYAESFGSARKPALITMDSIRVSFRDIDNDGSLNKASEISVGGVFMKSAQLSVLMSLPLSSSAFSFKYSGLVSRMKLNALNPFLEIAEEMRFKAGVLESATFEVNVVNGRAAGNVRAVYRGLTLAAISKQTGSENGILDVIASFVANNIKMRTDNVPGAMKLGKIKYVRQRDDPFFRYVWFSLRSGLGDVVGF